jgi:phage tail sheath gpL-like
VDTVNDKLTDVELESALNNGVSPVDFLGNGSAFGVMPITTYAFDAQSNPDARLLDTSRIDGSYFCARDLATFLAQEYPQKKIIDDLIAGQELPRGCVQIQTIRTSAYARARFWVSIGVVQSVALEAAIANGTFVVQRDTQDSSQVDMVVPLKIVPPLRKFSAVVNHTGP